MRYCDTFGARRPPSPEALPSDPPFHEIHEADQGIMYELCCADDLTNCHNQRIVSGGRRAVRFA